MLRVANSVRKYDCSKWVTRPLYDDVIFFFEHTLVSANNNKNTIDTQTG